MKKIGFNECIAGKTIVHVTSLVDALAAKDVDIVSWWVDVVVDTSRVPSFGVLDDTSLTHMLDHTFTCDYTTSMSCSHDFSVSIGGQSVSREDPVLFFAGRYSPVEVTVSFPLSHLSGTLDFRYLAHRFVQGSPSSKDIILVTEGGTMYMSDISVTPDGGKKNSFSEDDLVVIPATAPFSEDFEGILRSVDGGHLSKGTYIECLVALMKHPELHYVSCIETISFFINEPNIHGVVLPRSCDAAGSFESNAPVTIMAGDVAIDNNDVAVLIAGQNIPDFRIVPKEGVRGLVRVTYTAYEFASGMRKRLALSPVDTRSLRYSGGYVSNKYVD